MRIRLNKQTKGHSPWHFATDLFKPEVDEKGCVFDTGYLFAHAFGLQFYILWRR